MVNGTPFTQVSTIGRGGSSKVYQVQDPSGGLWALKRVTTENPKQFEALKNEVALLRQLRHQEQVIQVLDAEIDPVRGRIHIVMEQGESDLGRYLREVPELDLAGIQSLWRQMLEAVEVIHQARIVHSDLKPMNFVLVKGKLKVIDFGIAKQISNDTTNVIRENTVGTVSYMAPEAIKQGTFKISRAADVWSLGVILYQMVYGRTPLSHLDTMQQLLALTDANTVIAFPSEHRLSNHAEITKAQLQDVLRRCLQRDPRKRPSLRELQAHPFLRARANFTREVVTAVVAALMGGVTSALGVASAPVDIGSKHLSWAVLGDEVWEMLCAQSSGGELRNTGCVAFDEKVSSNQCHAPTMLPLSTAALAPLRELLRTAPSAVEVQGSSSGTVLQRDLGGLQESRGTFLASAANVIANCDVDEHLMRKSVVQCTVFPSKENVVPPLPLAGASLQKQAHNAPSSLLLSAPQIGRKAHAVGMREAGP